MSQLNSGKSASPLKVIFTLGGFLLLLLVVLWFTSGPRPVEKLLTHLVMPVGTVWLGLLVLTIVALQQRQKLMAGCLALLWGWLTVTGNGTVADFLNRRLEADYLSIKPTEMEPFDAVILMGGGTSMGANGEPRTNSSGGRIVVAAQMYAQGRTKKIICSGDRIRTMSREKLGAGRQAVYLLNLLGVPNDAIELVDAGENTTSEMKAIADSPVSKVERLGLLSSAWHLPRCLRIAKNNGLDVIPVPADFRSPLEYPGSAPFGEIVDKLTPKGEGVEKTANAMKEFLARLVRR